jgi:hypothetical protein
MIVLVFVLDTFAVWRLRCRMYSYPHPSLHPFILPPPLQRLDTPATEIAPTIHSAVSAQSTHSLVTVFWTAQNSTRTGQAVLILVRALTRGRVCLGLPHLDLAVGRIGGFLWAF